MRFDRLRGGLWALAAAAAMRLGGEPLAAQTILAHPYLQPGENSGAATGPDSKTVLWLTDVVPAEFAVEFEWAGSPVRTAAVRRALVDVPPPKPAAPKKTDQEKEAEKKEQEKKDKEKKAKEKDKEKSDGKERGMGEDVGATDPQPESIVVTLTDEPEPTPDEATADAAVAVAAAPESAGIDRDRPSGADGPKKATVPALPRQKFFKYEADLTDLPPDTLVKYRVRQGSRTIREAAFRTRASADRTIRFVAVGDLANGKDEQNAIAYQVGRTDPDFLLALGDIVYPDGSVNRYMKNYWRTYVDAVEPGPRTGAPLMASVPFYGLLGNHDVEQSLDKAPDGLAAYRFFKAPTNGPGQGKWNTPISRDPETTALFRSDVGAAYPALAFYSFDNGPAHFLVLDSCNYVDYSHQAVVDWIERDLTASKAPWKFVCYHVPAFQSSTSHYSEQKMRRLHPLFERTGVNVVFAGHVHNYQRSKPLRFEPKPADRKDKSLVQGKFSLDERFDGKDETKADGVIHIVAGGGGASLYKDPLSVTAAKLKKTYGDNYAPFTAKSITDRHSFVVCELSPSRLLLRAIDVEGAEIDRIVVTQP